MPIDRSREHHRERISEALRIELTSIVEGELGDPRIAPLALTEMHMNPGGKSLRAFVQVAAMMTMSSCLGALRLMPRRAEGSAVAAVEVRRGWLG